MSVSPGNIAVEDLDGVVVVPREVAGDVLGAAGERVGEGYRVRATIRDCASPLAAYEEYGVF